MLVLCLVWSLQQISLKAIAPEASPMLVIGLRSGVAALLVAAMLRWQGDWPAASTGRWRPGLAVGALFGLEYLFVAEALRLTHASHVIVFLYTAPIFAGLGLHLRLPAERLAPWQWAGIAIAFSGIAVAFLGRDVAAGAVSGHQVLLGDFLALCGGASWGATTVVIRVSRLSSAPAAETLLYQLLGACVLLPGALLAGQTRFVPSPTVWAHLAFQCVIVSFASFLVWCWLLRRYLASRLGVFSFLTPLLGVLLGVWLLDEPLEHSFLAGGALVLAGILLVSTAARAPVKD